MGAARGLGTGRPTVQVSLDYSTLTDALMAARAAVSAGVDWLEAGTPLVVSEGLAAVRTMRAEFPDTPIVVDLKTMDGGYGAAMRTAEAGGSWVVIMARSHPATVAGAVRAGRESGIGVMVDLMRVADKPAAARRLEEMGVDLIVLHHGVDERTAEGGSVLDDVRAVRPAVGIPLQAVGGLSREELLQLPALGVESVVVGQPLLTYGHADAAAVADVIGGVVHDVRQAAAG